jgi:hypothetical protein
MVGSYLVTDGSEVPSPGHWVRSWEHQCRSVLWPWWRLWWKWSPQWQQQCQRGEPWGPTLGSSFPATTTTTTSDDSCGDDGGDVGFTSGDNPCLGDDGTGSWWLRPWRPRWQRWERGWCPWSWEALFLLGLLEDQPAHVRANYRASGRGALTSCARAEISAAHGDWWAEGALCRTTAFGIY